MKPKTFAATYLSIARKGRIAIGVTALFLAGTSGQAGVITWTGLGSTSNFFDTANWDLGGYSGSFASLSVISADIVINNATITLNGALVLAQGYGLTATGSTITTDSTNGIFRSLSDTNYGDVANKPQYHLIDSTVDLYRVGTNSIVNVDGDSVLNIRDATVNGLNNYSSVHLDIGAQLTFSNGNGGSGGLGAQVLASRIFNSETGVSFLADYYNGVAYATVNFNDAGIAGSGPETSFRLTGSDTTPFGSSSATYGGSTNTPFVITAVPEPGSTALFLAGGTAMAAGVIRRRYTRR